jgi:GDP-L-fucose synthase
MDNFFEPRRIVVTGGAGFLGSYVVSRLVQRGCRCIRVPRSNRYDLTVPGMVREMYDNYQPDLVIHLAAKCGGIGANQKHPGKFFYDNAMMGMNLIEEGRKWGLPKFVTIGTVCSYPKYCPTPFSEANIWEGYPEETNAPYGLAKKMLLVQGQAYRQEYNFDSIYVIPVNLYGPGDNFDPESSHVIPALIKKCLDAKISRTNVVKCWGSGNVSREFLFAADAAEGILLATEQYSGAEPVNIGTGHAITIKELAYRIAGLTGFHGEFVWDTSQPDGQPQRRLDVSRAEELFGFMAKTPLEDGLKITIDWYKAKLIEELQEKR